MTTAFALEPSITPQPAALPGIRRIPHLAFGLDTVTSDGVDLEGMSFEIAGGRYTGTFIGNKPDQVSNDPTDSDAQFLARQYFAEKRLTEVNIHTRIPANMTMPFLEMTGADYFLTDSLLLCEEAGRKGFLLLPPGVTSSQQNHCRSVSEFIERTLQLKTPDTTY